MIYIYEQTIIFNYEQIINRQKKYTGIIRAQFLVTCKIGLFSDCFLAAMEVKWGVWPPILDMMPTFGLSPDAVE